MNVLYYNIIQMYLKLLHNPDVNSYMYINGVEHASQQHQISISNNFQLGWEDIGQKGGWYMGCCWLTGLENLTRKQLQDILSKVDDHIDLQITENTIVNCIRAIQHKLDALIIYIVSKSPIMLKNVAWHWHNLEYLKNRLREYKKGGVALSE